MTLKQDWDTPMLTSLGSGAEAGGTHQNPSEVVSTNPNAAGDPSFEFVTPS